MGQGFLGAGPRGGLHLLEAERIEVRILHLELESNRLARKLAKIGSSLPGDHPIDFVTEDQGAIL